MSNLFKRIARALLWPLRRFFDPRFGGIAEGVEANVRATLESTELLGNALAEANSRLAEANSRLINDYTQAERASGAYFERLLSGTPSDLDDKAAALLNHEGGSGGLAAQAGLWFNPPVSVEYRPGGVWVGGVNERAAEMPYVFRGLAGIGPGANVLDVGATESTVALSLASLGYEVTALDPRPYPLTHPRLRTVVGTLEEWKPDLAFDAVVCLSTIEHIGLAAYGVGPGTDGADLAAMKKMSELAAPGARLLLTTRYGRAAVDDFQRTYDRAGLEALLEGWDVQDMTFVRRIDESTWEITEATDDDVELVVMVTAVRST